MDQGMSMVSKTIGVYSVLLVAGSDGITNKEIINKDERILTDSEYEVEIRNQIKTYLHSISNKKNKSPNHRGSVFLLTLP